MATFSELRDKLIQVINDTTMEIDYEIVLHVRLGNDSMTTCIVSDNGKSVSDCFIDVTLLLSREHTQQ
jgi:hypothetical protein